MRRAQVLYLLGLLTVLCWRSSCPAADLLSHMGNTGPKYESGITPNAFGWGPDDRAYPDKFVVNPVDLAELAWVPAGRFAIGSTKQVIDGCKRRLKSAVGGGRKLRHPWLLLLYSPGRHFSCLVWTA